MPGLLTPQPSPQQQQPILTQYSPPPSGFFQQRQQAVNERNFVEASYNPDGTKPPLMRLAENKTWNAFADNLALPLLDGYSYLSGAGEVKAALQYLTVNSVVFDPGVPGDVDPTFGVGEEQ